MCTTFLSQPLAQPLAKPLRLSGLPPSRLLGEREAPWQMKSLVFQQSVHVSFLLYAVSGDTVSFGDGRRKQEVRFAARALHTCL